MTITLLLFGGIAALEAYQMATGAWAVEARNVLALLLALVIGPGSFLWVLTHRLTVRHGEISESRLGWRLWSRPVHVIAFQAGVRTIKRVPYPTVAVVEKATGKTLVTLLRTEFEGRLRELLPESDR